MKLIAGLLLATVTGGTIGTATITSSNTGPGSVSKPERNTDKVATIQHKLTDELGVIDGSKNPEMIPDRAAYTVLFRLVAGHKNRSDIEAKKRIRQYVQQIGLGKQADGVCDSEQKLKQRAEGDDKDVDAFIGAAEEFQQRVGVLDKQAAEIKKANWPYPSEAVMAELTRLQGQKESIVNEIVASLPKRLSANGMEKVRGHVNGRVKRLTKIKEPKLKEPNQKTLLSRVDF